jgi:hypothetical protein
LTTAPSGTGLPYEGQLWTDVTNDRLNLGDASNVSQRIAHYSSTGRTGGSWSRSTNLSISNGTETVPTFTTEAADSDGFLTPTSGQLTIPAGLGGIYAFDLRLTWASATTFGGHGVRVNGTNIGGYTSNVYSGVARSGLNGVLVLAAADTVDFWVVQNSGGALNITAATLHFYRLAI